MSEILTLDGVSKCYSRGGECVVALNNVSLHLHPGEIVMVVGGPLDGKTTLLQVAAGTLLPNTGTVSLSGASTTHLSNRQRSKILGRHIAWVNREGAALDFEVSSFVGWPLNPHGLKRRQTERTSAQILTRVGLGEHIHSKWRHLSHRQQVLAALARAFAGNPKLIVIDDLLNGLDGHAAESTIDLIRSLIEESPQRPGVLLSVSEMDTTAYADHVLCLHRGTLEAMTGLQENNAHIIALPNTRQVGS